VALTRCRWAGTAGWRNSSHFGSARNHHYRAIRDRPGTRIRITGRERRALRRSAGQFYRRACERRIEREQFGLVEIFPGKLVCFVLDQDDKAVNFGYLRKKIGGFMHLKCSTHNNLVSLGSVEGIPELEVFFMHSFFIGKEKWLTADAVVLQFVKALIDIDRVRLAQIAYDWYCHGSPVMAFSRNITGGQLAP